MNRWRAFWLIWSILVITALMQSQTPAPTLSTADKTALTDAEKAKQQAQQDFNKAQELELQVMREWESAHPGWKINPTNFAIFKESDAKPSATAAPAPHEPAGAAPKRSESTPQPPRK